jgi:hypothetical protein
MAINHINLSSLEYFIVFLNKIGHRLYLTWCSHCVTTIQRCYQLLLNLVDFFIDLHYVLRIDHFNVFILAWLALYQAFFWKHCLILMRLEPEALKSLLKTSYSHGNFRSRMRWLSGVIRPTIIHHSFEYVSFVSSFPLFFISLLLILLI